MSSKTASNHDVAERLIWVDLEMSDLDIRKGHILEMACVITDAELNIVAEGPDLVIHQACC
jgi:oligoribonuclease